MTTSVLDLVNLLLFCMFCSNCPPRVAVRPRQCEEQERKLILLQEEREKDSLHHPPSGQVPELLLDCVVSGWPQHIVCSNSTLWPAWVAHICIMWVPAVYIVNDCHVNHYAYVVSLSILPVLLYLTIYTYIKIFQTSIQFHPVASTTEIVFTAQRIFKSLSHNR